MIRDARNCSPGNVSARTVEVLSTAYRSERSGRAEPVIVERDKARASPEPAERTSSAEGKPGNLKRVGSVDIICLRGNRNPDRSGFRGGLWETPDTPLGRAEGTTRDDFNRPR